MSVFSWFTRLFAGSIGEKTGDQYSPPSSDLVSGLANIGVDGALQIDTVWACIDRRATTIASLPFFAYDSIDGQKELARKSRLYSILHDSPNSRMTPFEFWRAMILNYDLRGNAYARIDRDANGEAIALWPMPSDQVEAIVLDDGSMVYQYQVGNNVAIFADKNVLVLKNLGNGTTGLAKLEFMRSTTNESRNAAESASKLFGSGGKPTGILMIDYPLTADQRSKIRKRYSSLTDGSTSKLMVLEADMKYQTVSMSPEDQQLLETRQFGVESICRWFDVPPVLVHHSNVTAWGSGIEQIVDGFHKLTIRPMLVNIEQAVRKRVMSPKQRANMVAEWNHDALLRGNASQRADLYAKWVQNGIATRAEVRRKENLPYMDGTDTLTAQSNLLPLDKLGTQSTSGATPDPIQQ